MPKVNEQKDEEMMKIEDEKKKEDEEVAECWGPFRSPRTSTRGRSPMMRLKDDEEKGKTALPDVAREQRHRSSVSDVAASSNSQMQMNDEGRKGPIQCSRVFDLAALDNSEQQSNNEGRQELRNPSSVFDVAALRNSQPQTNDGKTAN